MSLHPRRRRTIPATRRSSSAGSSPVPAERQIWIPLEPVLRAVNSTPRPDWQKVAWTSLLYQLVGTEWVVVAENDWVWDHIYDEQTTVFPGHFWQRFDKKIRWFQWFYPQSAGQFRVAIKYHWYKTPLVPEHEFLAWGGRHYGDLENGTHEWCDLPD